MTKWMNEKSPWVGWGCSGDFTQLLAPCSPKAFKTKISQNESLECDSGECDGNMYVSKV